jgi:MHS family proline/betaine transporter-like MFS transporter
MSTTRATPVGATAPSPHETRKAVFAAAIGNVLEWYDFGVYAFFAGTIGQIFFPSSNRAAALLASFAVFGVGFLMRPLGGIVIGRFGDTHGRKAALTLTIMTMALGTVMVGVLPGYASIGVAAPVLLVIARLIQGFSAGGEWGGSTAFMAEWAPSGRRGWYASFQQASIALSLVLGSGTGALFTSILSPEALTSWGWRVPFLMGIVLALIGGWLRANVDETPVYRATDEKLPTRDSTGVRVLIVALLVAAVLSIIIPQFAALLFIVAMAAGMAYLASREGTLGLALRAFGFTIHWTVAFYILLSYMPTFNRLHAGVSAAEGLWSTTICEIVLMLLIPFFGMVSDRVGRKPLLLASCAFFVVLTIPLFSVILGKPGLGWLIVIQALFGAAIALFSGAGPAAIVEMFHTMGRSSWMTPAYALAVAIFGGFAPYIAQWLIGVTGTPMAPAYYVMAASLISFLVIWRMPETAHDELR